MAFKKSAAKTTSEPSYSVIEDCGIISSNGKGWVTKLRYLSWNGKEPKYDIRPWKLEDDGTEKCGKGITFTGEELESLLSILKRMEAE